MCYCVIRAKFQSPSLFVFQSGSIKLKFVIEVLQNYFWHEIDHVIGSQNEMEFRTRRFCRGRPKIIVTRIISDIHTYVLRHNF